MSATAAAAPDGSEVEAGGGGGDRIAKVLKSKGPVVSCVLLHHMLKTGKDVKPHAVVSKAAAAEAAASLTIEKGSDGKISVKGSPTPPPSPRSAGAAAANKKHKHPREVLTELIEEIQLDTTPSEKGVQKVLGGPLTFIGQYADEGIVLMKRADQIDDLEDIEELSVKELKAICDDSPDIVYDQTMLEKSDLVQAVRNAQLPINPHKLQPPFDKEIVRGDILILKVAHESEDVQVQEDDDPEQAMAKAIADFNNMTDVSNDEFFLDYTKEECVSVFCC